MHQLIHKANLKLHFPMTKKKNFLKRPINQVKSNSNCDFITIQYFIYVRLDRCGFVCSAQTILHPFHYVRQPHGTVFFFA